MFKRLHYSNVKSLLRLQIWGFVPLAPPPPPPYHQIFVRTASQQNQHAQINMTTRMSAGRNFRTGLWQTI